MIDPPNISAARRARGACRECLSAASSATSIVRFAFSPRKSWGLRSSRKTKIRERHSNAADFCTSCGSSFFQNGSGEATGASNPNGWRRHVRCSKSCVKRALADLPAAEATLERHRLLGSAVSPGIAHRVFTMEAGRPTRIVERLLEYPLQGDFSFRTRTGETRLVTLSGKTDRIDLLADGTFRVIDYKSKKTPDPKQALQLPIYSFCARESLRASTGQTWTIAEAMYLSFEGDKAVVALRAKGRTTDELLDEAQERLITALDGIAGGHFPPQPARRALCGPCPYRAVCRLEIVELSPEAASD